MKKRGFTLIELLCVITIIGIVLALIVVNVNYFSEKRRKKDYKNITEIIEKNTKILVNSNSTIQKNIDESIDELKNDGKMQVCKINYMELVNKNLMDKGTINPITNKVIDSNSYIKVTLDSNYEYSYDFVYSEKKDKSISYCFETDTEEDIFEEDIEMNMSYFTYNTNNTSASSLSQGSNKLVVITSWSNNESVTVYNEKIKVKEGQKYTLDYNIDLKHNFSNGTNIGDCYIGFSSTNQISKDDYVSYKQYSVTSTSIVNQTDSVVIDTPGTYYIKMYIYHNTITSAYTIYSDINSLKLTKENATSSNNSNSNSNNNYNRVDLLQKVLNGTYTATGVTVTNNTTYINLDSSFGSDGYLYVSDGLSNKTFSKIHVKGYRNTTNSSYPHFYIKINDSTTLLLEYPGIGDFEYDVQIPANTVLNNTLIEYCVGSIDILEWYIE